MSFLQADQPLEWFATHPSHTTRQKELEKQLPSVIRIREQCDVRVFHILIEKNIPYLIFI